MFNGQANQQFLNQQYYAQMQSAHSQKHFQDQSLLGPQDDEFMQKLNALENQQVGEENADNEIQAHIGETEEQRKNREKRKLGIPVPSMRSVPVMP